MATAEQAEVLPIVLTGQDNSKAAWDSLKRNASDAKSVVDSLSGAFEKLGGGNAAGGLEGLASKARLLLNPYVALGAAVLAVAVGAGVMHSQLSKAGEAADDLGQSARSIDGLQMMLNKAGGEAGAAEQALRSLQTTVDKTSRDGGYLEDLFKLNGSSLTDASGKVKPLAGAYKEVAGFIQSARNETERLEIATNAYGAQAAPAMVKAILSGATALDTLAGKSNEALDPAVKQAQEFDRLWKEITKSGDGLATTIRNAVLPVMGELYNRALQLAEFAGSKSAAQSRYLLNNPNASRLMDNQNEIDRFYNSVGFGATKTPSSRKDTGDDQNALTRAMDQIAKHTALTLADAQAVGQSAGEHERLRVQAQLVDAAQRAGVTDTGAYAAKFAELAEKAKAAADALAVAKLQGDLAFESAQLGRSALEQTVASRLRGAGVDPNSAQADMLAGQIRLNEVIKETQDISKDALKGLRDDLKAGVPEAQALANALDKVVTKLQDKALDAAINALTSAGGSAIGNFFGLGGSSAGGALTGQDLALNNSIFPGYGTGHSGAIIGQRSTGTKYISPAYFDDAPRFHGGGILGTNEVPFIGLEGEEVGFPDQLRRKYGGAGGHMSVTVNLIEDSSRAGQVGQRQGKDGALNIDAYVDSITAKNAANPGSATSRVLAARGQLAKR